MRFDLQVIASWVDPEARVLDLGCSSGTLLAVLREEKNIIGTGIDADESKVGQAIAKGLSVIHGDIYEEVRDYPDSMFDYVILSQTLQQVMDPSMLIREMLRIGRRCIVSFPNFSYWKHRIQFLVRGRAPVSRELPYEWHNTPNIRVIPIADFKRFCRELNVPVLKEVAIGNHHHEERGKIVSFMPNLLASYGIFLLGQPE